MVWSRVLSVGRFILHGLSEIVFPEVCLCCGIEVAEPGKPVCSFCLADRFEDANPENLLHPADELLPEGVFGRHALWRFDKGGALQELLHRLKYDGMTGVGVQLGERLGWRIRRHPRLRLLLLRYRTRTILVPVPLHYLKFVRRGYNQAFMVARGLQAHIPVPICGIKDVVRRKNTRSQTGFDLARRNANVRGAFRVRDRQCVAGKLAIIVDDVFTTGATSFELAGVLITAGAEGVLILTLAQA